MNIAFDYQIFTRQNYGGISRYISQLAVGLLELQQKVKIIAPIHINNYLEVLPRDVVTGIRVKRYPPKMSRLFSIYNHAFSIPKINKFKPNVIHETYYSTFGINTKSCPIVVTVHDMIHEIFKDQFSKYDNTTKIKKAAIERADKIICITENTKKDLIRIFNISEDKVTVIHHGYDLFDRGNHIEMIGFSTSRPFLLYVGSRGGYKNFYGLLKAISLSKQLLSDIDIVVFGGPKFSSEEISIFRTLGLSEGQVKHVRGNDSLLRTYYKTARAFVFPSFYEGFGMPPLEAMAHGCPVIASNTSSMPEVIGNAGQYFNPAEPDDIRLAIESVVYSDKHVSNLQYLGYKRLSNFSWSKCAKDTLKVYQSLV
jgi:glycosyltransferase involved in cell wall biosynthesis